MKNQMNTYLNVVPFVEEFADWLLLEDYVRSFRKCDGFKKMEVITGPIFYKQKSPS